MNCQNLLKILERDMILNYKNHYSSCCKSFSWIDNFDFYSQREVINRIINQKKYATDDVLELINNERVNEKNIIHKIKKLDKDAHKDITLISLILHYKYNNDFVFFRVNKDSWLEKKSFEILSQLDNSFKFRFSYIGNTEVSFENYLQFNKAIINFLKESFKRNSDGKSSQNTKGRQIQKAFFYLFYKLLGDLSLSINNFHNSWILTCSDEEDFKSLNKLKVNDYLYWTGNSSMKKGDLTFIYRQAPEKAIKDIFTIDKDPVFVPWDFAYSYRIKIKKIATIAPLDFKKLRNDPIIKNWSVIKVNTQGVTARVIPYDVYNALIDKIHLKAGKYNFTKKEFNKHKELNYGLEEDFAKLYVESLLKKLKDFKFYYQPLCKFYYGSQDFTCRIDFLVCKNNRNFLIIENKLKISNENDLQKAINQAKSYSLQKGIKYFIIAYPQGINPGLTFYKLNGTIEEELKYFTFDEIAKDHSQLYSYFNKAASSKL